MAQILQFPVLKENTERLKKLNLERTNQVFIDFKREKVEGYPSQNVFPCLAYGSTPTIDLDGFFLFFEPDFPEKIKKLAIKRNFNKIYKKLIKNLNALNKKTKDNNFFLIFEELDFDDLCDFWEIKASVSFNEEFNNMSMDKSKYTEILNRLNSMQIAAEQIVDEFILEVEETFYSKKLKLNKFNNMRLDLRIA